MYRAPVSEISHTLMKVAGLEKALDDNRFPEFSADLAAAILEEAGKFAAERVEPLRITGDKHGATVKDGVVTTAPGWKELYRDWIEGGRSEEHTSELQSRENLVCRLLLEKKT